MIVFALYGEASSTSNKKEGVVLQSQYAELNIEPYVEMEFMEGEERYTVRRVPRHLKTVTRGAAKGKGTREITGSVSLIMPDGTEYPQKETKWEAPGDHRSYKKSVYAGGNDRSG